jgi:hypothetical protein
MNDHPARALLQGMLVGAVMGSVNNGPLLITHIQQDHDSQGIYLPYFDVTLFSGLVLRVSVGQAPDDPQPRADDIRTRLRADMARTVAITGLIADEDAENFVESLVDDAMHQCELLLTEER